MAVDSALGSAFRSVAVPARTVFAHPVLSTPAQLLPVEWVAGPESVPATPARPLRRMQRHPRQGRRSVPDPSAPLLFSVVLLLGAVLLAPERPADQEAICQRHNGVAACRVW